MGRRRKSKRRASTPSKGKYPADLARLNDRDKGGVSKGEKVTRLEVPAYKFESIAKAWKQAEVLEMAEAHGIQACLDYIDLIHAQVINGDYDDD